MGKEYTTGEKWKKSIVTGLVFTFLFFTLFLMVFYDTGLTIVDIFKIARTSFFLSIPFYFIRRITLSNKPPWVFLINLMYGLPLVLWVLHFSAQGEGAFALVIVYPLLYYYTYLFFTLLIITIAIYLLDTGKINSLVKKLGSKNEIKLILILFLLIALISCNNVTVTCDREFSTKPNFEFGEIEINDDLQIRLDHTNKGDTYELVIFGNNTYQYIRSSPINEVFHGDLDKQLLIKLLKDFEKNRFNYMKKNYFCSDGTDLGNSEISLKFNDKVISVSAYASDGPDEFYKIKDLLLDVREDKMVNAKDLIESSSVDITDLQKENYLKVIVDDSKYCYGKNSDSDCKCQEKYSKIFDGDYTYCIPNLCFKVIGVTLVGNIYEPNYEYCEWAVRDARVDVCDTISTQQGKDICVLAYVGRTNNSQECKKIQNGQLKNECYI